MKSKCVASHMAGCLALCGATEGADSNAIHANEIGYRQCADGYYSVMCSWLAEDERNVDP